MASWLGLLGPGSMPDPEARFCKPHGMVKRKLGILDDSKNPAREGTNCAHSHDFLWLRIRAFTAGGTRKPPPASQAILYAYESVTTTKGCLTSLGVSSRRDW